MISGGTVLLPAAAERRGIPVAYATGLRMRRAAQLYDGTAKTDPKDAWVLADYARRNLDRLNVVQATDQQLAPMRALNGHDEDLAADQTRIINRLRDALLSTRPALERAIGNRLASPGILDVLRKYPTIGQLRRAGRARFPQPYPQTLPPPIRQSRPPYLGSGEIPTHRTSRHRSLGPDHPQPRRRPRPNSQQPQAGGKDTPRGAANTPSWASPGDNPRIRYQDHHPNPHRNRQPPPVRQRSQTSLLRRPSPHPPQLRNHPQRHHPQPSRQQTAQKRHAPSRLRRHPKRPPRPTLPNQTRPRQKPPHRPPPPSPAAAAHIILTMLKTQTPYNPHHQPNTT